MDHITKILAGLLLAAALWAAISLLFIWGRTRALGKRALFAEAAGGAATGPAHAPTVTMLPWERGSVRENLLWYAMVIVFHLGIFSAFVALLLILSFYFLPIDLWIAIDGFVNVTTWCLMLLGVIGGVSLLVRRATNPILRGMSRPDDYISNLLATSLVALSVARPTVGGLLAFGLCMASAIALLVYLPLGKIRRCFFFIFGHRSGAFFGGRGCMPPTKQGRGADVSK